jgi:hypothetical protein
VNANPISLIYVAGCIHVGIIAANIPLPGLLKVRKRLAGVEGFVRQIFYVHWLYIVLVLALFAALCFGFPVELAGASRLGRFFSGFMACFWVLRIGLQWLYYDRKLRREYAILDWPYAIALILLSSIFVHAALFPVRQM